MILLDAAKPLTRRHSANRAGWVSAIPLSLVVVMGALFSTHSHFLLRHDRELVVHLKRSACRSCEGEELYAVREPFNNALVAGMTTQAAWRSKPSFHAICPLSPVPTRSRG
jgi:hypothetical protein